MADADVMDKEELDEKAKKKEEKAKKKEEKKAKNKDGEQSNENEEDKLSSKILVFFITILIIAIWLGIIGILIKADVGGFGSTILRPLIKDLPYAEKILPEEVNKGTEIDNAYKFESMDAVIKRIKELEASNDEKSESLKKKDETISSLQSQVSELQKYKDNQEAFLKEKENFYKEVVYTDNAPDIEEYKKYYESIDAENAETLYKQVIEQLQSDEKVKEYAKTYSAMKPKEAAAIFDTMTNQYDLVAEILNNMDAQSRANILGKMDSKNAAALTAIMEPKSK